MLEAAIAGLVMGAAFAALQRHFPNPFYKAGIMPFVAVVGLILIGLRSGDWAGAGVWIGTWFLGYVVGALIFNPGNIARPPKQ